MGLSVSQQRLLSLMRRETNFQKDNNPVNANAKEEKIDPQPSKDAELGKEREDLQNQLDAMAEMMKNNINNSYNTFGK